MKLFTKRAVDNNPPAPTDDGSIDALLADAPETEPVGAPLDLGASESATDGTGQPPAADLHLQIRQNLLRAIGDE